ncbi:MAG TPA: MmgE/PrpD family protein, partial [Trueperaceae bacterium]|nr:MmgE/PrpD family protein [Trueperaceae bacterium]
MPPSGAAQSVAGGGKRMMHMTKVEELAHFVTRATFEDLAQETVAALKLRVLDGLGCAFGALDAELVAALAAHTEDLGGAPHCTLIGGGHTAPDRAAFYNGALVRYLDFNDSYIAPGETCHPSDSLAAVLAAAEYAHATGERLLTSLAVAYQVQCTLSDVAPVRAKGFDHTTQGAYAVAVGVSKALGLDAEQTANAIAMAGTSLNALRVTRTGDLSNWKGLAYPATAFGATHAALLASHGVTGPAQVFEGNKGFMEAIAGPFDVDWGDAGLAAVTRTSVKPFNAEIHGQSAVEGILKLRRTHEVPAEDVARIELDTFAVAYDIIGGGEEGPKLDIHTKEQADHSLPY